MTTAMCFDLDGTVTREEILPLIARETDLVEEISVLTQATIQGVIPFERSFRLRCRLLRDVPISRVHEVTRRVKLDDEVVRFIRAHHEQCFVITGNLDVWISPLLERLGCEYFSSTAIVDDDSLIAVDHVLDKGEAIDALRERFDTIVAIGEGMNDVPMFEKADVRVVHGGVHEPAEPAKQIADFWTMNGRGLCQLLTSLS